MKSSFKKLFSPRSVAIVGASNKPGKVGNMLAANILAGDYQGDVYFVNHKGRRICGRDSYLTLSLIGTAVDLAIIAVPAAYVEEVILAAKDVCRRYIVISAGFGESDIAGQNREVRLQKIATENNLTILGPNCLGLLIPSLKLNASFAPTLPASGDVAFISQSGALAVAAIDRAPLFNIGFSAVVSVGNKMQVDAAQLIDHFARDKKTHVIALYLESIDDGAAFRQAVRAAHVNGKQIVLLKAGRSQKAQSAISLHTGSLAGDDAVIDSFCERYGISRVSSFADLFNVIRVARVARSLSTRPIARAAVVTNAGGFGVILTDMITAAATLEIASLPKHLRGQLMESLPAAASAHNPVDLLGDAGLARYESALQLLTDYDRLDVIFVVLTPQKDTPAKAIARAIVSLQKKTAKDIVVTFVGGSHVAEAREYLLKHDILFFDTPDEAVRACDLLTHTQPPKLKHFPLDDERAQKAQKFVGAFHAHGVRDLYYGEVMKLARLYKLPLDRFFDVTEGLGAKTLTTYPCVVKVDNPIIQHKSDRGGVVLPIHGAAALEDARKELIKKFPEQGTRVIAQKLHDIKVELIIGMKRDPLFGPVCVVGMGGIYTEILNAKELFVMPMSQEDVLRRLVCSETLGFLFVETRGQRPYDAERVAHVVMSLAALATEVEHIMAIDINPFLIYNEGTRDIIVDMKIAF